MHQFLFKICFFTISCLLLTSCNYFEVPSTQPEPSEAVTTESQLHYYGPPECYIKIHGVQKRISEIYHYENNNLAEYWFSGSEGFFVHNVRNDDLLKDNYLKAYRFASLDCEQPVLHLADFSQPIDEIRNDTLIVFKGEHKVHLFIFK